jgi:glycosyltransferase involved in cell wall biosynthesis
LCDNRPMRLAWFSPFAPVRSGIATCSGDLVAALGGEHQIDCFVDEPLVGTAPGGWPLRSAHEFVWRHRRVPYDLVVYQLGNSSHHDYQWPYLFRYPGLVVLHDAHLHHARAAALLRSRRAGDYRAEFAANHPDVSPDLAEVAVAGFDSHLYYLCPMTRLVAQASRMTAVHTPALAGQLREAAPGARIEAIRLGHGMPVTPERAAAERERIRARYAIPGDAVLFGAFGALTPEKRIPQILDAFAALLPYAPSARLLLAGSPAAHYDVAADVAARGLELHVTLTGYIEDDEALTDALAAADVALNLRWPTAREVSGPWLRALAAGLPTITIDLAHTWHVPTLDPHTWQPHLPGGAAPVTVAIDILDEDHSLRLAMRRLAGDAGLRASLGRAGRAYWDLEHAVARMVDDYRRLLPLAAAVPPPQAALPAHLVQDGGAALDTLLASFGVGARIWSKL